MNDLYINYNERYHFVAVAGGSLTGCIAANIMLDLDFPIIYNNKKEIIEYFNINHEGAVANIYVINDQLGIEWSSLEENKSTEIIRNLTEYLSEKEYN